MHDGTAINRDFYNALWSGTELVSADRFNTWPLVSGLLARSPRRLELGPGLRPRLPVLGSYFIDISPPVIRQLAARGGIATEADSAGLPFKDGKFELVCAFDLLEHIDDDRKLLGEVSRVLKDGGVFIVSFPLHARLWTRFDEIAGHLRRYDPATVAALLAEHGLVLQKSAVYGMQPSSPRLVHFGLWWLENFRKEALWWYNRVLMPLGLLFQKRLEFVDGLVDAADVDEVVLVCRKQKIQHLTPAGVGGEGGKYPVADF